MSKKTLVYYAIRQYIVRVNMPSNSLYNQKQAGAEGLAKLEAERLAQEEAKRAAEEAERVEQEAVEGDLQDDKS
ncbi:hypothetical protein [Providencia sp. PROV123]|nr:hypothetical protein [Providencia sp. PROV123]QLQ99392.1 hypothetical protein H0912_08665 [Providencia rettgeri]